MSAAEKRRRVATAAGDAAAVTQAGTLSGLSEECRKCSPVYGPHEYTQVAGLPLACALPG